MFLVVSKDGDFLRNKRHKIGITCNAFADLSMKEISYSVLSVYIPSDVNYLSLLFLKLELTSLLIQSSHQTPNSLVWLFVDYL